jgi:hypothetical protein
MDNTQPLLLTELSALSLNEIKDTNEFLGAKVPQEDAEKILEAIQVIDYFLSKYIKDASVKRYLQLFLILLRQVVLAVI